MIRIAGLSVPKTSTCRLRHLALLVGLAVVHVAVPTTAFVNRAKAAAPAAQAVTRDTLPGPVADMREAILEAVRSSRLEDLKIAVDLNELKPELGPAPVPDPIAFWRGISADGTGKDILTTVGLLLDSPFSISPLGKDAENSRLFVWPAFADRALTVLTPAESALLDQLEPPAKRAAMTAANRYTGWHIVIGADGVWHIFRRYD
jgi:hypothetical protein